LTDGAKNDPAKVSYIKTKLILKGIDPEKWGPSADDNPDILAILNKLSQTLIGA
jgi:hypothetical protein